MSATSERMLKLMAYADGELEGKELEEVEAWLAEDALAARFANEVATLGDLVSIGHAESRDAKAVLSFDVADAVMAKIDALPAAKVEGATVTSLDAARDRRQKRLKVGAAAACAALALAASVFVMMRPPEEKPMARVPAPTAPVAPVAVASGAGVDVDLVETPGHSVSVFYLPSENTLTTSVVVWVDETGEKK